MAQKEAQPALPQFDEDDALYSHIAMTEEKQFELYEGDDANVTTSKGKYKIAQPPTQHPQYAYARSSSFNNINPNAVQVPSKVYCVAGYRILVHLLLMYCVFGVTYLLFFKISQDCTCSHVVTEDANSNINNNNSSVHTNNPSQSPSIMKYVSDPTLMPTVVVSKLPSNSPSKYPSEHPTKGTTVMPSDSPSKYPSNAPTAAPVTSAPTGKPTLQPTKDHFIYENHVGDFKISAQNSSHSNWLLCDGSFIDSKDYPKLFDIIGYSFGSFTAYPSLFALPNATDRVVGINGGSNQMGYITGSESIQLTQANLPSHYHNIINSGSCSGGYSSSRLYLTQQCGVGSGLLTNENFEYQMRATTSTPNRYRSASVGSGSLVNIMQPTVFVGNLFIWTD